MSSSWYCTQDLQKGKSFGLCITYCINSMALNVWYQCFTVSSRLGKIILELSNQQQCRGEDTVIYDFPAVKIPLCNVHVLWRANLVVWSEASRECHSV